MCYSVCQTRDCIRLCQLFSNYYGDKKKSTSYLILEMPGKNSPFQSSESPHLASLVAGQVWGAEFW